MLSLAKRNDLLVCNSNETSYVTCKFWMRIFASRINETYRIRKNFLYRTRFLIAFRKMDCITFYGNLPLSSLFASVYIYISLYLMNNLRKVSHIYYVRDLFTMRLNIRVTKWYRNVSTFHLNPFFTNLIWWSWIIWK